MLVVLTAGCDLVLQLDLRDAPPIDVPSDVAPQIMWNAPQGDLALPIGVGDDPTLTADLLELYWNTTAGNIARTTRTSTTTAWSASVDVPLVSSTAMETTPEVSNNGLTLYVASRRAGTLGFDDLMVSTRADRDAAWSDPVFVPGVNTSSNDNGPSATEDGLVLVFASNRPGGIGGFDIWMATRVTTLDVWGVPVNVTSVNTPGVEASPCIVGDGLAIYFTSNRNGSFDLFVATRARREDSFGPAAPITELNAVADHDEDPWVSPDERHMFYMRNGALPNSQLLHATR